MRAICLPAMPSHYANLTSKLQEVTGNGLDISRAKRAGGLPGSENSPFRPQFVVEILRRASTLNGVEAMVGPSCVK